ncbi:hypothetical protein DUI87_22077 [Hirundo rustica rustica]|uniref:Uncharacterized protein n=1 Tax=Hirundo rustica rustica TaxID=333673 RepID=A0A3M0JKD0_HIRRU|nr:hypothetical protein DUI87_22077 [Hirundo rustica rustica]
MVAPREVDFMGGGTWRSGFRGWWHPEKWISWVVAPGEVDLVGGDSCRSGFGGWWHPVKWISWVVTPAEVDFLDGDTWRSGFGVNQDAGICPRRDFPGEPGESWDHPDAEELRGGTIPAQQIRAGRRRIGAALGGEGLEQPWEEKDRSSPGRRRIGAALGGEGSEQPWEEKDRSSPGGEGSEQPWEEKDRSSPGRRRIGAALGGEGSEQPWEEKDRSSPGRRRIGAAPGGEGSEQPWEEKDWSSPGRRRIGAALGGEGLEQPWEEKDWSSPGRRRIGAALGGGLGLDEKLQMSRDQIPGGNSTRVRPHLQRCLRLWGDLRRTWSQEEVPELLQGLELLCFGRAGNVLEKGKSRESSESLKGRAGDGQGLEGRDTGNGEIVVGSQICCGRPWNPWQCPRSGWTPRFGSTLEIGEGVLAVDGGGTGFELFSDPNRSGIPRTEVR